jgi:hypothetical protein
MASACGRQRRGGHVHRATRPASPPERGCQLLTGGFEQHVPTQHDLGAVGQRHLLSTPVHAAEHDAVEQAVQEAALLLGRERRPDLEQASVGQLVGEQVVLTDGGEGRACLVEGTLAGFHALHEPVVAQQRQQLWVGDEAVEFVLGVGNRPCCLIDVLGGLHGLSERPAVSSKRRQHRRFDVLVHRRCADRRPVQE